MKVVIEAEVILDGHFTPERRLLCAVLERAVADLMGVDEDFSAHALAWFQSVWSDDGCFSYKFIVEQLDLGFNVTDQITDMVTGAQKRKSVIRECILKDIVPPVFGVRKYRRPRIISARG